MGKKKKAIHQPRSPQQSVEAIASAAFTKSVIPEVHRVMGKYGQAMQNHLLQVLMQHIQQLQVAILTQQRILGITSEQMQDMTPVIEDELTGHVESTEAIQGGDAVRIFLSEKANNVEEFGAETAFYIIQLLQQNPQTGDYQWGKVQEEGIVGMTVGETKVITVPGEVVSSPTPENPDLLAQTPDMDVKVTIKRVSFKEDVREAIVKRREAEENAKKVNEAKQAPTEGEETDG